jgi:Plasmid maintenance system antidote protein
MTDQFTPAWYIRQMLAREGVTQTEAAARMGISAAYLSDMLNGRRRVSPEIVELAVDRIETADKNAARLDLHRLGAASDGWILDRAKSQFKQEG